MFTNHYLPSQNVTSNCLGREKKVTSNEVTKNRYLGNEFRYLGNDFSLPLLEGNKNHYLGNDFSCLVAFLRLSLFI